MERRRPVVRSLGRYVVKSLGSFWFCELKIFCDIVWSLTRVIELKMAFGEKVERWARQ